MMELFEELMSLAGVPLEETKTSDVSTSERDENFRKWFGKSKVVTDFYKPMIMYHGSSKAFNEFKLEYAGSTLAFGRGFYFVNDKRLAKTYSGENGSVYECYIKMEAPYIIKSPDMSFKEQLARTKIFFKNPNAREDLLKMGYDGVMVKEDDGYMEVVVFNPNQIKSTINKTFNPASDKIYEAVSQASPFKLPNGVPQSLFKLTNSMVDAQKWKVKVLESYCLEKRKGSFDGVGYVMVSLKDNTIIPIARDDEHHRGEDLLYDYYQPRYGVNPEDYYPVFCDGSNYPYNAEEEGKLKIALNKCKNYGLDMTLTTVNLYYVQRGNDTLYTAEDFISGKAIKFKRKRKLTKTGEEFLKVFIDLKDACEYRDSRGNLVLSRISAALTDLTSFLRSLVIAESGATLFTDGNVNYVNTQLEDYRYGITKEVDFMNYLFGFNGLRNTIHNFLRNSEYDSFLNKQLGNVSELIEKLGAL